MVCGDKFTRLRADEVVEIVFLTDHSDLVNLQAGSFEQHIAHLAGLDQVVRTQGFSCGVS